jgi:hypothetical protein
MCNFWSACIDTKGNVYYSDVDSHDEIIKKHGLNNAGKPGTQGHDWMKTELLPPGGDVFNKEYDKWTVKVDQVITEGWYMKRKMFFDEKIVSAFKEARKTRIYEDAKDIEIKTGNVYLKNSSAVLWGSSSAVLWGSSSAVLWGSSSAELRGSSSAVLWGSSSAVLWGSSSAELWGSSSAVLRGSSSAVLRGSSSAELWGSSSAELWGSSVAFNMNTNTIEYVKGKWKTKARKEVK